MINHNGGSAYWKWVESKQHKSSPSDFVFWEPDEANPDRTSEELYKQRTQEEVASNRKLDAVAKRIYRLATPQEKQVIKMLQDGYNQNEIASKLGISNGTVNRYIFNLRKKALSYYNGKAY